MDMLSAFDGNVRKTPNKDFLRHDGESVTYAEAFESSRQAAAVLRDLGVGSGDRVALMCFNTTGFVYAMIGAWRIGATVVPVNHKLQPPEVDQILGHSRASVCIADGALGSVLDVLRTPIRLVTTDSRHGELPHLEELLATAEGIDGSTPGELDPAEILYTSGTTGAPKGCVHSHRGVTLVAMVAALGLSITRDERLLMAVPIWHASPLNNWLMGTMYMGGTIVLLREYHPQIFLETAAQERITLCFGPPVIYTTAMNAVPDFDRYDLSAVRGWIYGGGPIGADVARRLADRYRTDRFFQVYGMTETGPLGSVLYPDEQVSKPGSIGREALPGVDMRVVRPDGTAAAGGEIGEIWLRTETVMLGYLDDLAATAEAFAEGGWYRTGDIARVDEDGYLFIVDRAKDVIITGGENVYSKEVEDAISAHPDVLDVAVIGRPHPEWGQTVVAHVVVRQATEANGTALNGDALRAFLADRLARYKIPREYVFSASIPRTPTGKTQKHLLRTL